MIPFNNLRKQYATIREEILHVTDLVLSGGVLINGPYTLAFEEALEKRLGVGTSHVVCVHSGSQALEMIALREMEIWRSMFPNDTPTIVVPSLTYPATVNAFMRSGWQVILGDINDQGLLDLTQLSKFEVYQAICFVGLYGAGLPDKLPDNLIHKIIIEDAAQHWLADSFTQRPILKSISFDPTKNLPNYGCGGAIVCYDENSAEWFRQYRDNGKPNWEIVGTNSRISEVDAAQLLVKLRYLDDWQDRRFEICNYWLERFKDIEEIRTLINPREIHRHQLQKFVIDIDHRNDIQARLLEDGIECKIHYEKPLHEMDAYSHLENPGLISCASILSRRVLSLPFYPELTDKEVEFIADRLIEHVAEYSNY